jgi:gluconokinase
LKRREINVVIVIMGVSGSGKTVVGQALAERLGCDFFEGDDFHPSDNLAKMASGVPLDDEDRMPWLERLRDLIHGLLAEGKTAVLACSALKRGYRDFLRSKNDGVSFVFLDGDFDLISGRLKQRQDHYMNASLLESQFDDLEAPGAEEAISIDIAGDVEQITDQILSMIRGKM